MRIPPKYWDGKMGFMILFEKHSCMNTLLFGVAAHKKTDADLHQFLLRAF